MHVDNAGRDDCRAGRLTASVATSLVLAHGTGGVPRLRCDCDLRQADHEDRHVVVVITVLAAELVGSKCPDVALSLARAVAALRATGVRVWFVQDVTAPIERCCVVRIGIGDSYVGPAMAAWLPCKASG